MNVCILDSAIRLESIACEWEQEANWDKFGIEHHVPIFLIDIQTMIDGEDSIVLTLNDGEEIVGFMGIRIFKSPFSDQRIANEHFWYVKPKSRGIGSIRLIRSAQSWSKMKGCSHLMLNASMLASDLHDKVAAIYERMGANKIESSFLMGL